MYPQARMEDPNPCLLMAIGALGIRGRLRLLQDAYDAKYPKAVECLTKDREELLTFYDFPAEHWRHLRTTNPIKSTLATIRLRTAKTRGCLSRKIALTMVFKLALCVQSHWRRLNGSQLLTHVVGGVPFKDGARITDEPDQTQEAA